jgi:hypothetical protein
MKKSKSKKSYNPPEETVRQPQQPQQQQIQRPTSSNQLENVEKNLDMLQENSSRLDNSIQKSLKSTKVNDSSLQKLKEAANLYEVKSVSQQQQQQQTTAVVMPPPMRLSYSHSLFMQDNYSYKKLKEVYFIFI